MSCGRLSRVSDCSLGQCVLTTEMILACPSLVSCVNESIDRLIEVSSLYDSSMKAALSKE